MNPPAEQRIKKYHLERRAVVYVRQSSPNQVRNNTESRRVQLSLRDKAIALGWKQPMVIEGDLGLSAGGYTDRPGFQEMLSQVAMKAVGIILCVDASRLSRNSKDWANLFELCGFFETLIADLDQVYDLALPNDRLVLGIKGTVSEMELSVLRTRLRMGAESKASRGLLKFMVPAGYSHDEDGQIVVDPDRRVQQAIEAVFDQFDRCTSLRQLALWYRQSETPMPIRKHHKSRPVVWEIPSASTLRSLFKNPIYAGVYAYGRSRERVEYTDGRLVKKRGNLLPSEQWRVCIRDHHQAYISWERYLVNQDKIAASRPRWSMQDNLGPIRDGLALLSGLLRCGHCGKRVHVSYRSKPATAMYYCDGKISKKGSGRCLSFGSKLVDQAVGEQLCEALTPHAIEAACLAEGRRDQEQRQVVEQARLAVEGAQYAADRAFEQFDLVDPKNRLVADTLEERLNSKLVELQDAKIRLEQLQASSKPLAEPQRIALQQLGHDFSRLWHHEKAAAALKKQLLRTAIVEIVVTHEPQQQRLQLVIHWQGGVHTKLHIKKRATPVGSKTDPSLVKTVRDLAEQGLSDAEIARVLNMKRVTTPRNKQWSQDRVASFRKSHRIKARVPDDDAEYLTGKQVADELGISRNGVLGLLRMGALHNHQVTDFAPWRIPRCEVESAEVKKLVAVLKRTGRLPRQGGELEGQLLLTPEEP